MTWIVHTSFEAMCGELRLTSVCTGMICTCSSSDKLGSPRSAWTYLTARKVVFFLKNCFRDSHGRGPNWRRTCLRMWLSRAPSTSTCTGSMLGACRSLSQCRTKCWRSDPGGMPKSSAMGLQQCSCGCTCHGEVFAIIEECAARRHQEDKGPVRGNNSCTINCIPRDPQSAVHGLAGGGGVATNCFKLMKKVLPHAQIVL